MRLALALFWLAILALLLGLTKAAAWLVIAFFAVMIFQAPLAMIVGVILGNSVLQ
jgi:hypothetical protein